ncbi:hypothetical protein [Pseudomonas chlororaphis]|uniref:hypothetical protein n=1 Tax=Pseudomonas chlororaphis TaxID=587753 RepID=UPI00131A5ACA|nr:hypothetical protein [Pseudomonas chlororaphis]
MKNLEAALKSLAIAHADLTNYKEIMELAQYLRESQKTLDFNGGYELPILPELPGVYYFEARFKFSTVTDLHEFGDRWGRIRAKTHDGTTPRYYPSRANHHLKALAAGEPIPLYLGKRESIADRITNHVESLLNSKTYALKLRARRQILNNVEVTYSYQIFDIPQMSYFGIGLIESELRKILNPILGKQ